MSIFCPACGNILFIENLSGIVNFTCRTCPLSFPIKKTVSTRSYYQVKDVDDIFGGEESWKNCDITKETCPKCSCTQAYFLQIQIRSADEPMTTFYRCSNPECCYNWRD